jgi:hypothetical protein
LRRFRAGGSRVLPGTVAGLVFVPYLLAAGFVLSPALKLAAALLLAACGLVFAMEWLLLADGLRRAAHWLLTAAAASLLVGMAMAVVYSLLEYAHRDGLAIPLMARFHGIANGPGFVLLGLLGWFAETRSTKTMEVV